MAEIAATPTDHCRLYSKLRPAVEQLYQMLHVDQHHSHRFALNPTVRIDIFQVFIVFSFYFEFFLTFFFILISFEQNQTKKTHTGSTSGFMTTGNTNAYGGGQSSSGFGTNTTLFGDNSFLNKPAFGSKRAK